MQVFDVFLYTLKHIDYFGREPRYLTRWIPGLSLQTHSKHLHALKLELLEARRVK